MDFTEIYKQSSSLVAFSPGAKFILTAVQDRIIVRRTDTFQITRTWLLEASAPGPTSSSQSWISHIGWSSDSEYILAACSKRGVVFVRNLRDEEWRAKIEIGTEGLAKAEWAPDGRTILCFSDWGLRVTLWSLVTGTSTYIQFPVHPERGYAFRADGRYFLLAERHKSKDSLGLYDATASYKLVRVAIADLDSFHGNFVAVWEGPLEYKLFILSLSGSVIATFSPEPDPGFGIRHVAWHPSGLFLAVGGWDDRIYILNNLTWSSVATIELSTRLSPTTTVWREPSGWLEATEGRGFLSYEKLSGVQVIPSVRTDQTKPHPKSGATQLTWNETGTLLLVRFESVPTAVHIYDFPSADAQFMPKLRTVLLHTRPVLHARWNPVRKGSLAMCCGGQSVYTWSDEWIGEGGVEEEMAECIAVPAKKFDTRELKWAPDGKGFILVDKDQFCCAFEVQEEGNL